ncbi:MAG: bifunctional nicotinamidase/pyrazinamidase [Candidatus Marinimicrobia bacterium]|nr:bifunctional nicotinamidase/pyrazinamidase [Candidatus Neomarinimicrobiota bacterium]
MKTLIMIDLQNDFMPGGALEVPDGDAVVPVINAIQQKFDMVIATQDWHPPGHKSFASSHKGKKVFDTIDLHGTDQVLWPDHCVQGSKGADFHPDLDLLPAESIFRKGTDSEIDSYSAFFDNGHQKSTGLAGYLREKGADELYFCGLAADVCVYFSIMDAVNEAFTSFLLLDATRPLDKGEFSLQKKKMRDRGVKILQTKEL